MTRILTNGRQDPRAITETEGTNPSNSPRDNVRADAELVNDVGTRTGRNTNPALSNGSLTQNQVAPIQQPSTAQSLGSLASSAGETLTGDYRTSGLIATSQVEDSLPSSPISIGSAARLFVQDAAASTDAVRIQSNAFIPPADPRSLQIWYEGAKPVVIDVATVPFNGLIYAPNAPVTITGTGNFTGAVVGQSVSVSLSGDLKIVSDLNDVNQKTDTGKANREFGLNYQLGEDGSIIHGWKPVSWSEFKRPK